MAEFRFFYKEDNRIKMSRTIETVKTVPIENFLWIDLNDVTVEVESELEQFLKIYIQEEEEMEEIEISSRYIETADSIVVNSQFLLRRRDRLADTEKRHSHLCTQQTSALIQRDSEKDFCQPSQLSVGVLYFCRFARYPCRLRRRYDRGYGSTDNRTFERDKDRR